MTFFMVMKPTHIAKCAMLGMCLHFVFTYGMSSLITMLKISSPNFHPKLVVVDMKSKVRHALN